jgi:hypothetical protein
MALRPLAKLSNTRTPAFSVSHSCHHNHHHNHHHTLKTLTAHQPARRCTTPPTTLTNLSSNQLTLLYSTSLLQHQTTPLHQTTPATSSVDLPRSRPSICHSLATSLVKVELENSSHCHPFVCRSNNPRFNSSPHHPSANFWGDNPGTVAESVNTTTSGLKR